VAAAPTAAPVTPAARKAVKLGTVPTIASAPVIIAQERGYFGQEGLDIEAVNFQVGSEAVAPLASSQLDAAVGFSPSAGLLNAIARNVSTKIVASNGSLRPNRNLGGFVVRKDLEQPSGYVELVSLPRPVRAATGAGGLLPHALLLLEAERAGLGEADLDVTFVRSLPDVNAALRNNAVDLGTSGEPLITIGEQQGILARWKPLSDLYPDLPFSTLLYGPGLLERERDAGQRLMRAYLRGARDYADAFGRGQSPDEIVGLLSGPLNTPPPLFDALQERGGLVYLDPNGARSLDPLRPVIDVWTRTGALQPGFDLAALADLSFADTAVGQLGRYQ
jgi:NitT/TauT family transport system substrate-binding protein